MKKLRLIIILFFLSFNSQSFAQSVQLKKLAKAMQGSYNSTAQHLKDTTNYFDIRLQIKPIWKKQKNGYWYYVEQAVASSIDKPYRQRVYHLIENSDGSFSSFIFTFNEPLRYTHKPKLLEKKLTVDSLQERKGCEVKLKIDEKRNYIGSTNGKSCPSDRKGASYATSEVIIVPNELHSWDRGFNDHDEQVWGATEGAYIFIK